jgi:hypothetical protein
MVRFISHPPVRLGIEAIEAANIAASLKGMTLTEYATQVLLETANRDIDEFVASKSMEQKPGATKNGGDQK